MITSRDYKDIFSLCFNDDQRRPLSVGFHGQNRPLKILSLVTSKVSVVGSEGTNYDDPFIVVTYDQEGIQAKTILGSSASFHVIIGLPADVESEDYTVATDILHQAEKSILSTSKGNLPLPLEVLVSPNGSLALIIDRASTLLKV
jgi:hypothetical protein